LEISAERIVFRRTNLACLAIQPAAFPEERLHDLGTSARQNSATNFHLVIQLGVVEQAENGTNGSGFRVIRAIHQAADAGMNQSPGAHRARFNCSKQLAASQAMVAKNGTGSAQGHDFSMRGRIVVDQIAVPALADQLAIEHNHRTDGDLSHLEPALCGGEGFLHPEFI
jgi:hypothetical protein